MTPHGTKLRLIVNPSSRSGRGARHLSAALPVLQRGPWAVEVCESRSAGHFTELVAEAAAAGYGAVVVCGGDGSLYAAVGGVVGTQSALGLLPLGTGNDFAMHAGLPLDPAAAAEVVVRGHVRTVDVGLATGLGQRARPIPFNCVAGVGLDADAIRHLRAAPWITGSVKYAYGGLRALWDYRAKPVTVTVDDGDARRRWAGKIMFVAVTNTRSYGGGMLVSPTAELDDGRLDVCVVGEMGRGRMLLSFPKLYEGRLADLPRVKTAQAPAVVIDSPVPLPVCLDGEFTDLTTPVRIEALPRALRLLAP
jgi:diacylglycerol kinase (ATP)